MNGALEYTRVSTRCVVASGLYLAFFMSFGLLIASLGPTLLELGRRSNSQLDQITLVFTVRSFLQIFGAAVAGYLIDKYPSRAHHLLCGAAITTGLSLLLMANTNLLVGLILLGASCGLGQGVFDTCCNVLTLWLHGANVAPYMQTLHAMFGVGAFLAPLFVHASTSQSHDGRSFNAAYYAISAYIFVLAVVSLTVHAPSKPTLASALDGVKEGDGHGDGKRNGNHTTTTSGDDIQMDVQDKEKTRKNGSGGVVGENDDNDDRAIQNDHNAILPTEGRIDSDDPTFILPHLKSDDEDDVEVKIEEINPRTLPPTTTTTTTTTNNNGTTTTTTTTTAAGEFKYTKQEKIVLALVCALFSVYVGLEVSFGGFVFTYGVTHFKFSNNEGEMITALFWGMIGFGRFLAVFVTTRVSAKLMLLGAMLGSFCGTLLVLSSQRCGACLWAGTAIFGLSMSSIYPSIMTLVEGFIVLSAKATAMLSVWSSFGEMAVPLLTGNMIQHAGPSSFCYIVFLSSIFQLLVVMVVLWQGQKTPLAMARAEAKRVRLERRKTKGNGIGNGIGNGNEDGDGDGNRKEKENDVVVAAAAEEEEAAGGKQ